MDVKVDVGDLARTIHKGLENGLALVTEQVLKDCNEYCLEDEGDLKKSAVHLPNGLTGEITWNTPYARIRYYTGTPHLHPNPNAKLHWAERAAEDFGETWAQQIAKKSGLT